MMPQHKKCVVFLSLISFLIGKEKSIANKQMKQCSNSLTIREMKIMIFVIYIILRLAKNEKSEGNLY